MGSGEGCVLPFAHPRCVGLDGLRRTIAQGMWPGGTSVFATNSLIGGDRGQCLQWRLFRVSIMTNEEPVPCGGCAKYGFCGWDAASGSKTAVFQGRLAGGAVLPSGLQLYLVVRQLRQCAEDRGQYVRAQSAAACAPGSEKSSPNWSCRSSSVDSLRAVTVTGVTIGPCWANTSSREWIPPS